MLNMFNAAVMHYLQFSSLQVEPLDMNLVMTSENIHWMLLENIMAGIAHAPMPFKMKHVIQVQSTFQS